MKKTLLPFLLSVLLLLLAVLLSIAIGSVFISPLDLWQTLARQTSDATLNTIIWDIRLPRTALIMLTGAALAGSGGAYQGLFRNPWSIHT